MLRPGRWLGGSPEQRWTSPKRTPVSEVFPPSLDLNLIVVGTALAGCGGNA
jgi:hypothetical protein